MPCLLLLLLDPTLPPAGDLDRFRHRFDAEHQAGLCHLHAARLRWLRGIVGHDGGRWDDAAEETLWREDCWRLLAAAGDWRGGEPFRRRRLRDLRELLGPKRYAEGWSPPLLPEFPAAEARGRGANGQ